MCKNLSVKCSYVCFQKLDPERYLRRTPLDEILKDKEGFTSVSLYDSHVSLPPWFNHTQLFYSLSLGNAAFCVYGEEAVPSQQLLWTFEELDVYLSLNLVHCPVPQHWAPSYSLQITEVSAIHWHCHPLTLLWKLRGRASTDHHGLLICILWLLAGSHVQWCNIRHLPFFMPATACHLH